MSTTEDYAQTLSALPAMEQTVTEEGQKAEIKYKMKYKELELKEKSEFLEFRKNWSKNLLQLVIFIVVFNALFLVAVGLRWLSFLDEWLVRLIVTGSFVEVLGLAKIVVEFLFKEKPAEPTPSK